MSAQLHLSTSNFEPALVFYQTLVGHKPITALEDYALFSFEGFRLALERRADPISVNPLEARYGITVSSSEAVFKVAQRLESVDSYRSFAPLKIAVTAFKRRFGLATLTVAGGKRSRSLTLEQTQANGHASDLEFAIGLKLSRKVHPARMPRVTS